MDTCPTLCRHLDYLIPLRAHRGPAEKPFWPTVNTAVDVDYLGVQGFWVCVIVACFSLAIFLLASQILMGIAVFGFFFLGGVGVREHSRFAAGIMFVYYVLNLLVVGFSVLQIIILALFLSNLRATWIASRWKPDSDEAEAPPRMGDTWADKFSDRLPQWLGRTFASSTTSTRSGL